MTLAELIAAQRTALAGLLTQRQALTATLQQIRDNLTDPVPADVTARIDATLAERTGIDAQIDQHQARISELEAEQSRDDVINQLSRDITPGAARPAYDRVARIGAEARTYRPDTDPTGRQFLRDVGLALLHPNNAQVRDRLERHDQEGRREYAAYMDRAAGTGAFAGLTVPQYLTEMYAPLARAMRPFADACNSHELPPNGMTLNLSRITTGTSAAIQASENSAVSETNIDDTLLTLSVQTNSGQQTLSRQAIERGTGTEDVTVQDLFRAYHTTLDSTLLNQATTGLTNVATSVAYTDASPTVAEAYPKIVQAVSSVESAMLNMASGENVAVMHSRRWYWLQNALSSTWPLMSQPGIAAQMLGTNYGTKYGAGVRGILPNGTPVIVDNNCGTLLGAGTEDEIYVGDRNEFHLWEDPSAPVFIRAEQPAAASLGVLFVLYGFFAYTFTRYAHSYKVNGTGLIAPSFTGV